jgi:hypothetical protein
MIVSKKRLSRTVIEGGRYSRNKWERRTSSQTQRAQVREYMISVNKDVDFADEYCEPNREKVYKEFKDKLGPMYRWLRAQVGRVWNDVRSEVTEKFDSRTTAGRHILYDHLLSSVDEVPNAKYKRYAFGMDNYMQSHYKNDFYVDDAGILRQKTFIPRVNPYAVKFDNQRLVNWLNGRVVGKVGEKLFWFVPADKNKKRGGTTHKWKTEWARNKYYTYYGSYGLTYLYSYSEPIYAKNKEGILVIAGYKPSWREGLPNFRQDRKLEDKDVQFWNSIPSWYQTKVLEFSPTYPKELKPSPFRY